jgi:hypothetical protein
VLLLPTGERKYQTANSHSIIVLLFVKIEGLGINLFAIGFAFYHLR